MELVPFPRTVDYAFAALARNEVETIVVPIENASSGIIADTVDLLISGGGQWVVRECAILPIKLVLLASSLDCQPEFINSHPAPLTHAKAWLRREFPNAIPVGSTSTSEAARLAVQNPNTAALAGEHLAEIYGLKILRADVQADVANRTKFYAVTRSSSGLFHGEPPTHTALIFEAAHRPGSLVAALKVLSDLGLNLTMIQSRPIPGRFDEYRFFIEFEGVPGTEKGEAALAGLKAATHSLNLLGSYPIVNLS